MGFPYPTNNSGNISISYLASYMNTVTNDMFWNLILFAIVVASLSILLMRGAPKEEAFVITSMFGLILSGLMSTLHLIYPAWIFVWAILLSVSVVLLWKRGE